MSSFLCLVCQATFNRLKGLRVHAKKYHPENVEEIITGYRKTGIAIQCPDCKTKQRKMTDLLDHVSKVHNVSLDVYDLTFDSENDYEAWLDNEEKINKCTFTRRHSKWKLKNCHRSGFVKVIDVMDRKRRTNQLGSCKINGTCTAYIQKKEVDGKIKVHYCSTHFGHECDLNYVRLSKEEKELLADKLKQGIPIEKILSDIQSNGQEGLRRLQLINRQDLINVCRTYRLKINNKDLVYIEETLRNDRGKKPRKIALVFPRHKEGYTLKDNVVKCRIRKLELKDNIIVSSFKPVWKIKSGDGVTYVIQRTNHNLCDATCEITCADCKICKNSYSCTCPDHVLYKNICKHIHAVCIRFPENDTPIQQISLPLNPKPIVDTKREKLEEIISKTGRFKNILEKRTMLPENILDKILVHVAAIEKLIQS